ncbi:interleukin 17-like protein [Pecten maximus]|uniref:interleukin 17-like protein n=1 Tax=Pecten maximus TaxID=6579 RepID=UPI0014582844|nr:interleukin 17-like protein [Pecten maximus]
MSLLMLAVSQAAAVVCNEPSVEDLTQLKSTLPEYLYINSQTMYGEPISNNDRCPSRSYLIQQGALNTVCPSYDYIESDLDRIPVNISHTRCLCRHCLIGRNHRCHVIRRQLPVLKKTGECRNGEYVYNVEMEQVAVGCTCLPR